MVSEAWHSWNRTRHQLQCTYMMRSGHCSRATRLLLLDFPLLFGAISERFSTVTSAVATSSHCTRAPLCGRIRITINTCHECSLDAYIFDDPFMESADAGIAQMAFGVIRSNVDHFVPC